MFRYARVRGINIPDLSVARKLHSSQSRHIDNVFRNKSLLVILLLYKQQVTAYFFLGI